MGRPLSQEDIDCIVDTFKDMEKLSTRQKIFVFLPSIVFTSWLLYQYYYITTHSYV